MVPDKKVPETTQIAGLWKIVCAFAILFGHMLVTLGEMFPQQGAFSGALKLLTFFGSRHFFFFSGYLAASGLFDLSRPMGGIMKMRFARIYVLVLASVALGVGSRYAYQLSGLPLFAKPWPSGLWQGEMDWSSAFSHLLPTGLVATNDFNYAIWYLYHELRLILLFPLFRWILQGGYGRIAGGIAGTLAVAVVGEHFLFGWFPLFRTSPFLSLGYAFIFLVGASTWSLQRWLKRQSIQPGLWISLLVVAVGMAIGYLESFGIRPPFQSPPLMNVQTVLGQMLVFLGICWLFPRISCPRWLLTVSQWSVGIYIVHPPIHQLVTHLAIVQDRWWLLWAVPVLSVPAGGIFYHWVVEPLAGWLRILIAGKKPKR